jgi:hypothetical protein
MNDHPIEIAGIFIPSSRPFFLVMVGVHIAAGITCVIAGLIAMRSRKAPGRHPRAGRIYYRSLIVVCLTMTAMAAMRWPHDNILFVLGLFSFACAFFARRFIAHGSRRSVRAHIFGMGGSYTLLLVAFYVDNGEHLPIWKDLPPILYWLLPTVIALPITLYTIVNHPLAKRKRELT